MFSPFALMIPIVGMIGGFCFAAFASWTDQRTRERTAFYRSELLRKLAEAPSESARLVIELDREDSRRAEARREEGQRAAGIITTLVGLGIIGMFALMTPGGIWGVGLVPLAVGLAMILNAYVLAPRRRAAAADPAGAAAER